MDSAIAWAGVEKLVTKTVHDFQRKHGNYLDLDEMLSRATEAFFDALESHKPAKSKFSTWCRNVIWWKLLDYHREEVQHAAKRSPMPDEKWTFRKSLYTRIAPLEVGDPRKNHHKDVIFKNLSQKPRFNLEKFALELSDDAREMVRIAVTTFTPDGRNAEKKRDALTSILSGMGWSYARITESIHEIRDAL